MKTFLVDGHNVVPLRQTKRKRKRTRKGIKKIQAGSLNEAIRKNIKNDIRRKKKW